MILGRGIISYKAIFSLCLCKGDTFFLIPTVIFSKRHFWFAEMSFMAFLISLMYQYSL